MQLAQILVGLLIVAGIVGLSAFIVIVLMRPARTKPEEKKPVGPPMNGLVMEPIQAENGGQTMARVVGRLKNPAVAPTAVLTRETLREFDLKEEPGVDAASFAAVKDQMQRMELRVLDLNERDKKKAGEIEALRKELDQLREDLIQRTKPTAYRHLVRAEREGISTVGTPPAQGEGA